MKSSEVILMIINTGLIDQPGLQEVLEELEKYEQGNFIDADDDYAVEETEAYKELLAEHFELKEELLGEMEKLREEIKSMVEDAKLGS